MDPMIPLTLQQRPDEKGKIYGVAPAVVTAVGEGEQDGRGPGDDQRDLPARSGGTGHVQVYFPWLQARTDPALINPWARLSPVAGAGAAPPPQVGDEVLCAFERGDIRFPFVIARLWKTPGPQAEPPAGGK